MGTLPHRTEGAEVPIASSGISFHLWRLYQHFWLLVCLLSIGVKSVSGGVCILQVLTCLRHILISPILRTRIRPRMGAQIAFDGRCDQQVESYQQSQRAEGWDS